MKVITAPTDQPVVPVFAPVAILENVSQITPADGWVAIRSPLDFSYTIDGGSSYITVESGSVLGINPKVTSIDFLSAVNQLEVM